MKKSAKISIKTLKTSLANHQNTLIEPLLNSEGYNNSINKGLRFFTKEELNKLEERYQDGMTWKEVDAELTSQGMIFKKSTFRKYLQEKKLPASIDYKKSRRGREAVYPKDTIRRINYLQYLQRIADTELIDLLAEILAEKKVSAIDAITERLESQDILHSIHFYLHGVSFPGEDIEEVIGDVLGHDPDFYNKTMAGLEKIKKTFEKQFDEWVAMLVDYKVPAAGPVEEE